MIRVGVSFSIALLPFWCFDAKGGEVVLLGFPRDLHGSGTSMLVYHFSTACVPLSLMLNSFALVRVRLCLIPCETGYFCYMVEMVSICMT